MSCGGFKANARDATADEQAILDVVKQEVEQHLGKTFSNFRAVKFNTQVVAGVIYLFKVEADDGEFVHAKVIKPLPHTGKPPSLMQAQGGLTADSPLVSL